jgi:hypothetical protein
LRPLLGWNNKETACGLPRLSPAKKVRLLAQTR